MQTRGGAGNGECPVASTQKHPHECGEVMIIDTLSRLHQETSLRRRGGLIGIAATKTLSKETPHLAEKILDQQCKECGRWNPSQRGEVGHQYVNIGWDEEAPPRKRGRLSVFRRRESYVGNTPTDVGKMPIYC